MRIIALIFMVITFLIGGGVSFGVKYAIDDRLEDVDYEAIAQLEQMVEKYKAEGIDLENTQDPQIKGAMDDYQKLQEIPSESKATALGISSILLGLAALVMVIFAFMKKESVKIVGFAVIIIGLLLWLVMPEIPGSMGAAPVSTLTLAGFIALSLSALSALLSYNLYLKKQKA